ncbi:MAG TPA: chromate efflux transporter [Steroidobacteraceae bacterium]|jgi:chromate transporter|nr:chromate efflux transporter [Steroidobacteraceae bacterium]
MNTRDTMAPESAASPPAKKGSPGEVLRVSLQLGLTSFGGPIAHLGYFNRQYVQKRHWLSAEEYAGLVSLCQLLPGPTSSQVGFLIGLRRAGYLGALAAWIGFTLPSAVLMLAFAILAPHAAGPLMQSVLHGLMLTAVVVVSQAVWSMARTLTPDAPRAGIALSAAALLAFHSNGMLQLLSLAAGAAAGSVLCRNLKLARIELPVAADTRGAWIALALFAVLLIGLPALGGAFAPHGPVSLANLFYRAGALVFGGGHVVLPLLHDALVPGHWITEDDFLAGYGLAQAMPGPLFTFAAFLGAASAPAHATLAWGMLALAAIFLPGLLLSIVGLSLWSRFAQIPGAQPMLAGVNAAVVGVLGAALYNPIGVTAIHSATDAAVAVVGFVLLQWRRIPPIVVAALCVAGSVVVGWNYA